MPFLNLLLFSFFSLCYVPVYLRICLKFCPCFFIIHISIYFCIPAFIPFYFCDSFLCLCFLWETNHCLFLLSCLYFFYFDTFCGSIFLHYSLQFFWVQVFFKCNKNIEFTFTIFYFVSFCITGVACFFALYSWLVGFFTIILFSFCFSLACIYSLLELISLNCSSCFICYILFCSFFSLFYKSCWFSIFVSLFFTNSIFLTSCSPWSFLFTSCFGLSK